jgi:hypothetical protein
MVVINLTAGLPLPTMFATITRTRPHEWLQYGSMELETMPITAFTAGTHRPALPLTLTVHLPAAAQATCPGERPMGSIARIEVKAPAEIQEGQAPLPRPTVKRTQLTLTF